MRNFLGRLTKNANSIYALIIATFLLSIIVFVIKFNSNSFKASNPEDWSFFTSYLSNIVGPVLAFLNLIIFIRLTKSVQRASENKAWVERTETLMFELIDAITKEATFFVLMTKELSNKNESDQRNYIETEKIIEKVSVLNNLVTESHFKLRLFVESETFSRCKTKVAFVQSANNLMPLLNNFIVCYSKQSLDKAKELNQLFGLIEAQLKTTIDTGKKFSDEIYYL